MKLNVKYMIAAFALLGLVGCDKNFEEFETSGGGSPAAVELSTVVSEALPGQIKLGKHRKEITLICRFAIMTLYKRKISVRLLLKEQRKC